MLTLGKCGCFKIQPHQLYIKILFFFFSPSPEVVLWWGIPFKLIKKSQSTGSRYLKLILPAICKNHNAIFCYENGEKNESWIRGLAASLPEQTVQNAALVTALLTTLMKEIFFLLKSSLMKCIININKIHKSRKIIQQII